MTAFSVQWISDSKEHGLVASKDIDEGSVIFSERPLVCAQYLFNRDFFPACGHCLKSLERPGSMIRRLAGLETDLPLPDFDSTDKPSTLEDEPIFCHACDQERYCSEECRRQSWEQYHNLLCVSAGQRSAQHPLAQLEQLWKSFHFPPESATVTLVTRIIASVLNQLDRGMSVDDAMAVYNEFKSQYHNADIGMSFLMLNISENRSSSDVLHRFFEGSLDGEITKMHQLIKEALYDPRADELFTEQAFRYFMSIIALNGQGIGTSALEHYQRQLLTRLQDCDDDNNECTEREAIEMVLEQIEMLEPAIDEVSGEFTHCEGSGLYRMHSKINHSCVPNAIVQFPDNSSTLQVVAIRPINAGEEICISYLEMDDCCEHDADDDDDCCINGNMHSDDGKHMVTDRRETLRQFYLFDCNCPACIQAAGEVAGK